MSDFNYLDFESFAIKKAAEFKKKADHNKFETLWGFKIIMISTLSSPLFVAFGYNDITGKIIPAILSLLAASFTAWLQLRKPQTLWKIYRTSQRNIENEIERFQFKIDEYDLEDLERGKALFSKVSDIFYNTHLVWVENIPSEKDLRNKEV